MRSFCLGFAMLAVALAVHVPHALAKPVIVAGDPDGIHLTAEGRRGAICVAVQGIQRSPEDEASCAPLPPTPRSASPRSASSFEADVVYGVVAPEVARVKLFYEGARFRADTVDTVASSAFADVRFFLVTHDQPGEVTAAETRRVRYMRSYDAAGKVVGAYEAEALFEERGPVLGPTTVVAGASWRVTVAIEDRLAGTPIEPERRERALCVGVVLGENARSSSCFGEGTVLFGGQFTSVQEDCDRRRLIAYGVADADVDRVELVYTDGRRRVVALRGLPRAYRSQRRVFGLVVPRSVAVRRAETFGVDGRRIGEQDVGAPEPARSLECDSGVSSLIGYAWGDEESRSAPPAGTPVAFAVSDRPRGVFCARLLAPHPRGEDCGVPSEDLHFLGFEYLRSESRTIAGAIVPARVNAVEFEFADSTTQRVPATRIAGYTGPYVDSHRQVILDVAKKVAIVRTTPLDVAGNDIRHVFETGPDDFPIRGSVRTVATFAAGFRLLTYRRPTYEYTNAGRRRLVVNECVELTSENEPGGGCPRPFPPEQPAPTLEAWSSCSPRAIVLEGTVTPTTRAVFVRLARGAPLRAVIRGDAWYAVVARDKATREVLLRTGAGDRTIPLRLPPASRQCGYSVLHRSAERLTDRR